MRKSKKAVALMMAACIALTGCGTKSSDGVKLDDYLKAGEYKGVEIVKADIEVSVENTIKSTLEKYATYEEVKEGKVKDGDVVNIDYVGTMNGEEFDNGSAQGQNLEIGSNSFIEGFESGLIGVKVGKSKKLNLKFPDPYTNNPDFAGKDVTFDVKVNYIQGELILPEYNDEFIKTNLTGYEGVEDYEKYLRELAVADLSWEQVDKVMEVTKYPKEWMDDKVNQLYASYTQMFSQYGYTMESYLEAMGTTEKEYKSETLKKEAEVYVKQKLIAEYIAAKEKIKVSDKEFDEQFKSYMTQAGYTDAEEFKKFYTENYKFDITEMIKENLLLGKVQDLISENAKEVDGEASITPIPEATAEATAEAEAEAETEAEEAEE